MAAMLVLCVLYFMSAADEAAADEAAADELRARAEAAERDALARCARVSRTEGANS